MYIIHVYVPFKMHRNVNTYYIYISLDGMRWIMSASPSISRMHFSPLMYIYFLRRFYCRVSYPNWIRKKIKPTSQSWCVLYLQIEKSSLSEATKSFVKIDSFNETIAKQQNEKRKKKHNIIIKSRIQRQRCIVCTPVQHCVVHQRHCRNKYIKILHSF